MANKRMIILDLASLGIGEAPDANRFFSIGADTLGHIASKDLNVANLKSLGLGNIRWDNEIDTIAQEVASRGFYGKMVNVIDQNDASAGFREMFDYTTSLRTTSVMDLMAEQKFNVAIISSFANYLEKQDEIHSVQVPNDSKAFVELNSQMDIQDSGLIYCQLPELKQFAHHKDVDGYTQQLSHVDKLLGKLMDNLRENDILIVTSSYASDPSCQRDVTREYLPIMVYNLQNTAGKSLGIKRSAGVIANVIAAYFDLDNHHEAKPNFIKEIL